ncbi:uncharacterized protein MONBRDRAFT_6774 [Monosiga brevicollis MX1]|uniref:Uncharacterized protein n=1 Tax=Monosiga brevicollis TaxID=81824 RepID=A9UV98_MONBE|nr:uncharacterized protein MONBRDRAFT_6774 [Monosiga brevicollis MX1]EDQ90857.1 predicted protein [Monosiga brevicollis MX1]|eukprot:XP_001744154.1 hypothetical protein [Monosiga brevicollis MX1]
MASATTAGSTTPAGPATTTATATAATLPTLPSREEVTEELAKLHAELEASDARMVLASDPRAWGAFRNGRRPAADVLSFATIRMRLNAGTYTSIAQYRALRLTPFTMPGLRPNPQRDFQIMCRTAYEHQTPASDMAVYIADIFSQGLKKIDALHERMYGADLFLPRTNISHPALPHAHMPDGFASAPNQPPAPPASKRAEPFEAAPGVRAVRPILGSSKSVSLGFVNAASAKPGALVDLEPLLTHFGFWWGILTACGQWYEINRCRRPVRFEPETKPVVDLASIPLAHVNREKILRDGRAATLAERQQADASQADVEKEDSDDSDEPEAVDQTVAEEPARSEAPVSA